MLKDRETPLRRRPLDRIGLALLVIWVGCLQVLLDKGNEFDWFSSNFIVILAVIVVVSFSLFLVWELTDLHPIVDLELFRHRNFGMSALALSLAYGLFLGSMVIQSLWLQTQMGYTAQWAGHALAPERMASATGTQNFLRTMCGSFGTSLSIALWTRHESVHRAQLAEHISIYAPQTTEFSERLGAAGMPPDQVQAVFERILSGQANMLATNDVFWLPADRPDTADLARTAAVWPV